MTRFCWLTRGAVAAVALLAALGAPWAAGAQVKIGLGTPANLETNGSYVWLRAFADELEKAGMDVVFYPNSALGNETERADQLSLGLLEVNDTGTHEIGKFSKLFQSIELPFLYNSYAHLYRILDQTDFLDLVNAQTTPYGIRVVDMAPGGAMYGVFNNRKSVSRIEDMADLRMRAMDTTQLKFMSAWGVRAVQVAWEEVGQALQTGIAEGYLNPPTTVLMFGHARLLPYYTDLKIGGSARAMAISEDWYQSLDDADKETVHKGVDRAREVSRRWNDGIMEVEFRMMRDAGITVSEVSPEARRVWVQRTRAVYDEILPAKVVQQMLKIVEEAQASIPDLERQFQE